MKFSNCIISLKHHNQRVDTPFKNETLLSVLELIYKFGLLRNTKQILNHFWLNSTKYYDFLLWEPKEPIFSALLSNTLTARPLNNIIIFHYALNPFSTKLFYLYLIPFINCGNFFFFKFCYRNEPMIFFF